MTRRQTLRSAVYAGSLVVLATIRLWAQTPAPAASAPAAAGAAASAPAQGGTAPAGDVYAYDPDGRRDPFVSLLSRGAEAAAPGKRTEGLASLGTDEVLVRGVLLTRGSYIALVQSPDGKTFTAHVNDHLADGTVRSINPQGIVIMQEVNDPLSLVKQREVRKGLRASDDVNQ